MAILTPLGKDVLLLEGFEGQEELSRPFRFSCRLLSTRNDLPIEDLLNQSVCLQIRLAGGNDYRYIHGNVRTAKQFGRSEVFSFYSIEVVPWFWFLSLTTDCRIFQDMTVPEIVAQIFGKYPMAPFESRLVRSYPRREYCVQYRESDFSFVSRLLEEEGIHYFFEHSTRSHVMVLADAPGANRPCPGQPRARYARFQSDAELEEDVIFDFAWQRRSITTRFALDDYDFEQPEYDLLVHVARSDTAEKYDYPGKFKFKAEGQRYARLRLDEELTQEHVVEGDTNCRAFYSGTRFALLDHDRANFNNEYLLVRLEHKATDNFYRSDSTQELGEGFSYKNRFWGIPHEVPFRPEPRTPKPVVKGSQTAVVVGPKGWKLYPDQYGRVKVQFFWDRRGDFDENSSCWIRVSYAWAGAHWGTIVLPRIGQEVIVDFLEGDPDRPIITGRVYNAKQRTPWELPAKQSISGTKSKDIEGNGYNEISFDDADGDEKIVIHAQRNMHTVVENDETIHVNHDRTEAVGNNETITIGNDRTETVNGNETISIIGDRVSTINGNHTEGVGGNHSHTVAGNQTEAVGKNRVATVAIAQTETIGVANNINVGVVHNVNAGIAQVLSAGVTLSLIAPGGTITIGPSGITIEGKEVVIKGGVVKINC